MPSNFTENYNLSQWERTDKVQMEDFNEDNARIDEALGKKAEAAAVTALSKTVAGHTAALAGKGNCQIYYSSYTGDGSDSKSITFPQTPLMFFIMGDNILLRAVRGVPTVMTSYSASLGQALPVTWKGNTVSWSGSNEYGCNMRDEDYFVIALIDANE